MNLSSALVLLLLGVCCLSEVGKAAPAYRVINGYSADNRLGMVVLLYSGQSICSGTIVGPRLVLTAAHCMCGEGTMKQVFPGITTTAKGLAFWLAYNINGYYLSDESQYICDSGMDHGNFVGGHDIALVRVDKDFDFVKGKFSYTKCGQKTGKGSQITVAGFGRDAQGKSGTLLWGNVKSLANCPEEYVPNAQLGLCYDGNQNYQKTAPGDSGGPAFDESYQVIGVNSGKVSLSNGEDYGVMVSVVAQKNFIKSAAQKLQATLF